MEIVIHFIGSFWPAASSEYKDENSIEQCKISLLSK